MNEEFKELAEDLARNIIDCDTTLIECEECKNDVDFIVSISPVYLTLDKGTNIIMNLRGETRIWKTDEVFFICSKCKKIILESCL